MEGIGLMKYSVETTERFDKEFKKLDKYTQRMIKAWIDTVSYTHLTLPTNREV